MTLDSQIEAILYQRGEPIAIKKLAQILKKEEVEIKEALKTLEEKLTNRGLKLVSHDGKVMLGTDAGASSVISELSREELERELGKASLETLSLVLYKGPISKKEIDYIRGVNSSYILRNLLIRGLIEKAEGKKGRGVFYKPTIELLSFLNLQRIEQLPEYEKVKEELKELEISNQTQEDQNE